VLSVFAILLVARLLAVYNLYFLEEDEISLAAGIAALVRDNAGDLYRYTPQWGYHRLVEWLTLATGGDVSRIPWIMKLWSVVVGALVPSLGLVMFRDRLSIRERWLVVLALAVNPILWHSSQYGNSAMGSLGFVAIGIALLSNPGGRSTIVLGLASLYVAIFVRADAILALPMFVLLVRLRVGSWRRTLLPIAALGVAGLVTATAIWFLDPRLDSVSSAVMMHMFEMDNRTLFWEYLIWAASPLLLALALLGVRSLATSRPALLAVVAVGALVPMLFYFRATTTPRYFLLAAIPLSLAIAVGIEDLVQLLLRGLRPAAAWVVALGVATIHLFIGLGQFPINQPRGIITEARIPTHDGLVPTGALLYDAYLRNGLFHRSFRNDGFGELRGHWEPRTYRGALAELEGRTEPQTVLMLFGAGWDHTYQFHAQVAGAEYLSRAPSDPSYPFSSETWMRVGNVRVMTIGYASPHYEALTELALEPGSELWITGTRPFPTEADLAKVPDGVTIRPVASFDERIRIFRAEAADQTDLPEAADQTDSPEATDG
jgi:hypothetical protein